MGKYFTNETLDGLWTRLVNKTKELYETKGDGSYIYTSDDHEEYICGACGCTNGLGEIPCSNCGNVPDFGRSLINTGMRGIHNALLSYTGLERNTSATKLADYMKGIATCARYVAKGYTDYTSKNTLEQIVKMLEEGGSEEDKYLNDLWVLVEDNGSMYDFAIDVRTLDPGYAPTPDTITIEIYDLNGTEDPCIGRAVYSNTKEVYVNNILQIAEGLERDGYYEVRAIARKAGYDSVQSQVTFTWPYATTSGHVFKTTIWIDETDVRVTTSSSNNVVYGYTFYLYNVVGDFLISVERDAPGAFEYSESLSSLFSRSFTAGDEYTVEVVAHGLDGETATASVAFVYGSDPVGPDPDPPEPEPEPDPELDYSAIPDAVMEEAGEICIQNYKDSKYNGSEVILTSRWYLEDGSYNETTYWYTLYDGYVYKDLGTIFQGEAYMSEAQYLLYIRDPDNESNATTIVRVSKPG